MSVFGNGHHRQKSLTVYTPLYIIIRFDSSSGTLAISNTKLRQILEGVTVQKVAEVR